MAISKLKQGYLALLKWALFTLTASLFLGGCGSDSLEPDNSAGSIQLINGIVDSPNFRIKILDSDDDVVSTISSLPFQGASTLSSLARGTYEIEVIYEDPNTGYEEVLLTSELDIHDNTMYVGLLNGTFDINQLNFYEKPIGDISNAEDTIEVQVINLSADSIATYLGDASQGLNSETLVTTIAPGIVSDPMQMSYDDDADYHVRLSLDGNSDLLYDSREISVKESTRVTIVINDAIGPDPDSPSVFIVTDAGSTSYLNDLADSGIRVINSVSDAGDASITVETYATGEQIISEIFSPDQVSDVLVVNSGFVDVTAQAPSSSNSTLSATVALTPDTAYSIVLAGSALEDDVSIRANEIDLRQVANAINIHFVNTLRETDDADVSKVDFYVLPIGDSLSDTVPVATGVNYLKGESVIVGAVAYDMVVTTAGSLSILAGPTRIFPLGGERVIAVATEAVGGGRPNRIELTVED